VEQELNEELQYHLDRQIDEFVASGLSSEEARYAALRALGAITQNKEECRNLSRLNRIENLMQDLRYGARTLRKSPAFSIVGVLTLSLGIGASTSIFSVAEAVLLRPLPYPNPERIVRVWEQSPHRNQMNLSDPNFDDFHAQNSTFDALAVYGYRLASVSGGSEPVRVDVAAVSSGFFRVLGVPPVRGRGFAPDEQRLYGTPAAIVSYGYWQRYLGGASDLSKFQLRMEADVYPVIGVMPAEFDFPRGAGVWISRELHPKIPSRTAHNWRAVGRVRDGITVAQARADLSAVAHRIKAQHGTDVDLSDVAVMPLADSMIGGVRTALFTLLGAVGLLLLVACANVAGLLVARTSARRKELAVRAALGAGRGRLVQQFLAESFLLSLASGVGGIALAAWAVRLLPAILPVNLPMQENIAINSAVLLFALTATVAVALSLGLFAAWRGGAGNPQEALRAGSRGHTSSTGSQRFRGFLVTGEIATTLVILVGAALLARSFLRLISIDPGFDAQNLVTMEFSRPIAPVQVKGADEAALAWQIQQMDRIVSRMRSIPGVDNVGVAGALPVARGDNLADGTFLILDGQKSPTTYEEFGRLAQNRSQTGHASYCVAGQGYFRTLGIPLLRGRMFGEQDDRNAPHVAVISQTLARQRWPNQDPIGRLIHFGNMDGDLKPLTIVGVVGDVRARGLNFAASSIIYVNYRQRGMRANASPTIVMRSDAPLEEIASAARSIFRDLVPDSPVKFSTFENEIGGWFADRRFLLILVGIFAAAAMALAAVGIYGVVAFSVARRSQEIGVRMAIGARRSDVGRLVLGEAARMAAVGVLIGVAASLAITRLISTLLFGVSATDPLTFAGVAMLLSAVVLAASYIPARRAMTVDPMTALRYE
jgi:predicted permease